MRTIQHSLNHDSVPLAAAGTSSTQPASTAFVQQELGSTTTIRGTHLFGIEAQPQNSTYYIGENGLVGGGSQSASTTESDMIWWPILPVTLRDLYIYANTPPAAGQTATVTLMKNGVATSLTAQITSVGGVISDTANTVSAGPGDYLSFRSVLSATSGTLSLSCSVRFTDPGSAKGISLIPFNYLSDAAAARVNGGLCLAGLGATEPARYPVVHDKCNIASYYEQTTSTGTVGPDIKIASTARMFAKQTTPYVLGATNTELSAVAAPSVPLTQYSHYLISNPTDGAAVRRRGSWSMQQRTSGFSPNQIKPLYFTSRSQAQNTTLFMGGHLCIGHATEATKQFPVTAGVLKNFILLNESAGVNAQTWTANVRINGALILALPLVMSGVAADQYAISTDSAFTVVNGDRLSVQLVSSATTGTCSLQFACDHTVA